jgi:uncharacterized membrane protein YukC
MSKYDPFETTEERLQRHFVTAILFVSVILAVAATLMVHVLEQHHEMERYANKKYLNKSYDKR